MKVDCHSNENGISPLDGTDADIVLTSTGVKLPASAAGTTVAPISDVHTAGMGVDTDTGGSESGAGDAANGWAMITNRGEACARGGAQIYAVTLRRAGQDRSPAGRLRALSKSVAAGRVGARLGSTEGQRMRRLACRLGLIAGLLGACGDDVVAGTETEGGTESSSSSTEPPTPTTTMTNPTTTEPNTGTNSTTAPSTSEPTTTTPTDPSTTEPITSSTSSTTETTTVSTSDTDTDTDTDGTATDTDTDTGGELMGRSVSQTVNSGTVASSPNFKMVFTLGQPTQNQGVYTSPSFKLQGGLIGANGNPP